MKYFNYSLLSLSLIIASSVQAAIYFPQVNLRDAVQSAKSITTNPIIQHSVLGGVVALSLKNACDNLKISSKEYRSLPVRNNWEWRSSIHGFLGYKKADTAEIEKCRKFRNSVAKTVTHTLIAGLASFYIYKQVKNA